MSGMHILYLVPDLIGPPGGIARCCRIVCQALKHKEIELSVLALHDQPEAAMIAAQEFPHIHYQACGGNKLLFTRRAFGELQSKPQIVLLGHPHFASLGWLIARAGGARLSIFLHGVEIWEPLSPTRRFALQRADQLIAVSRFTAQRAAKANGISLAKTRILYHCIDSKLQPLTEQHSCNRALSLLTVSRIHASERYKGHDRVIRAMPSLLARYPELVYHITGDGDGRKALEALAQQIGVKHAVHFHGIVSDEELMCQYRMASVFVMPSCGEGFGIVFLEAMAYGKPVVAGNLDATVEVVKDGETGLLVNPGNLDELVIAIDNLLADEQLRQRMGARGAEVVATEFSFEKFREHLLQYLLELV